MWDDQEGGDAYSPHPNPLISLVGCGIKGMWFNEFLCYCMMKLCYYMILIAISIINFVCYMKIVVIDIWKWVLNKMRKNLYFLLKMMFDDVRTCTSRSIYDMYA